MVDERVRLGTECGNRVLLIDLIQADPGKDIPVPLQSMPTNLCTERSPGSR
jgi:hypothetical protein